MSEPKAAPLLAEAHAAKKATKKSRRSTPPSAAATAAVAAAAASNPSPVPRIALAEPKADSAAPNTGDAKRRASKKRTAVSSTEAPSSSRRAPAAESAAPSAAATVDAAAAKAEDDAERERQSQRREAKRQRAKEQEAARRREELAKQALEDARRQEEQRQRELRQKQQLQELNADAHECDEAEDDEYEDDGFENYDDDFEEPEPKPSAPVAVAVAVAAPRSAKASAKSRGDDAELKRVQQAMQAESKGLSSSRPPSSSDPAAKTTEDRRASGSRPSSSIASSIAGLKQSLDPRAKRVKELLARRKLEVDKFHLFQQSPLSEHDRAMHRLRRGLVRQAFVQTSDGARTLGTQTKPPPMQDRGMLFPDDIGVDVAEAEAEAKGDDMAATPSATRFFRFLEHAAYACEVLAVENVMAAEAESQATEEHEQEDDQAKSTEPPRGRRRLVSNSALSQKQLFPSHQLARLPMLERELRARELSVLRFSPAVSSLVLTSYSPRSTQGHEKHDEEQEPPSDYSRKALACVWDVNLPHRPLHVLTSEGVVSVATLGPSRELFALAGTQDGSLHVWDLRPQAQATLQAKRAPLDGLVPSVPVYSTCGANYRAPEQHRAAVVALEPLPRRQSAPSTSGFQFGSMDDRGVLLIWSVLEFEPQDEALVADKCVEIGGRVKLVLNARMETQEQAPTPRCGVGPMATTLAFFPHDPNQFVVGTHSGLLLRGHRFAKASPSPSPSPSWQPYRRDRGESQAAVVCLAFHPSEPEYLLAGYEDGSVCLFHTAVAQCLTSWEDVAFGVSVCAVAWSPSRPAVFLASFSNAQVLVWDLLECTNGPTLTHELETLGDVSPVDVASSLYPLALSSDKTRTSRPAVAWRSRAAVSAFQFAVHELGPELATRAQAEPKATASVLASIL